jgi:hypothetical protein
VLEAIAALGRTEDVSWSPDGRRIALAGIAVDKLLILGVDCLLEDGRKCVHVSDAMHVASSSLKRPHGVCWVSDGTVAVASVRLQAAAARDGWQGRYRTAEVARQPVRQTAGL